MTSFKHKDLFNSIDNGVILIDDENKIVCWNEWISTKSFLSSSDVLDKDLITVFPQIRGTRLDKVIQKSLTIGHSFIIHDHLGQDSCFPLFYDVEKKNQLRQRIFTSQYITDEEDTYCMIQIFDQTNKILKHQSLKAKNENLFKQNTELKEAKKLANIGRMATSIIHEINNPVSIVKGMRMLLEKEASRETFDREKIKELGQLSESMAIRIDRIIKGIKVLAHNEKPSFDDHASIKEIIYDAITLSENKISNSKVTVETADVSDSWKIWCDSIQISQIIINLISNAIDEINDKNDSPWIKLSARETPMHYEILVTDCGPGIPQEVQEQIFDAFYTSKKVGKGTGLGLSISKSLAELHGGDLYIDNDSTNTCFALRLLKDSEKAS